MTTSEPVQLENALYRFADHELDQWENWRLDSRYGPVYMRISRELPAGESAAAFDPIPRPQDGWETGRFAEVTDAERVGSREDLMRVISQMRADFARDGAREWENRHLADYLEALEGFLCDLPGAYSSRGEPEPAQPDWALLARILITATGCE